MSDWNRVEDKDCPEKVSDKSAPTCPNCEKLQKRVEWLENEIRKKDCPTCELDSSKELSELRKENEELRKCHESELGVCQEHCDVVKSLRELLREAEIVLSRVVEMCYAKKYTIKPNEKSVSELSKELLTRIKEAVK